MAAWIACAIRTAIATGARDPDGRAWMARTFVNQVRQGGQYSGLFLEVLANFAYFAGDPFEAARMYSASRAQARRSGTAWPRQPLTVSLIEQVQAALSRDDHDRAWREGAALTAEDILTLANGYAGRR